MLQVVNVEALKRSAEALVGPEATNAIMGIYRLIDQAMKDGYELGKMDAEQNVEELLDAAFDNGFEEGALYDSVGYDQGYLEGVRDARANPEVADETVVDIINDLARQAFNGEFDINNVTDSGDEA